MIKEKVSFVPCTNDSLLCICGNNPLAQGLYSCDEDGKEVNPDEKWRGLYRCDSCQRIISILNFDVVSLAT